MAYKESLSMLIILIIFMLASFLNGYTPEYVQLWSLGGQTVLSGIPHSFLNDYAKFSNPPRVYFATINGFVLTGLNLIDIKLQPTFYSTYLKIDAYRKTGSTLSWLDFGVIMTNDIGVQSVNAYQLNSHSGWATFSSQTGPKSLIYNVTYTPVDPTLFQSNMEALIGFSQINCSNSVNDLTFSLAVLEISSSWITFQLSSNGSTVFYPMAVDILVFSKAFQDSHGFVKNSIDINPTDSWVYNLNQNVERSASGFVPFSGDSYFSRPVNFYSLRGVVFRRVSTMTPYLRFRGWTGENSTGTLGYHFIYGGAQITPLAAVYYDVMSICEEISVCIISSNSNDIDFNLIKINLNGLQTLGDNYYHSAGLQVFNFALKDFLSQPPLYFMAGAYSIKVLNPSGNYGGTLIRNTTRSFDIMFQIGPDFSILDDIYVYYGYSNWKYLKFSFFDFSNHPQFASVFGTGSTTRTLTYDVPSDGIDGTVTAKIFFTRYNCTNRPSQMGFDSSFLSYNGSHAKFIITVYGDIQLSLLEGTMMIYFLNTSYLGGYQLEFLTVNGMYPPHPSTDSNIYSQLITNNSYPDDYRIVAFQTGFDFNPTINGLTNMNLTIIPNLSNSKIIISLIFYYDSTVTSANYLVLCFLSKPRFLIYNFDRNHLPTSGQNFIYQADFSSTYGLLVTSDAVFLDQMFKFGSNDIPRIFQFSLFSKNDAFSGTAPLGQIDLPRPSNLSFWVLKLQPTDLWNIYGYYSVLLDDLNVFVADQLYSDYYLSYDKSTLTNSPYQIKTIQASSAFAHNATNECYCNVQVNFNGVLRALYFNEEFILSGSSMKKEVNVTLTSSLPLQVVPSFLFYVIADGYKIFINKISLTNCKDLSNASVSVLLSQMSMNLDQHITFEFNVSTTTFSPGCLISKNATYCYRCQPGYVNNNKACTNKCSISFPYIANGQYCVAAVPSRTLRTNASPTYDPIYGYNDSFEIDIDTDSVVITIFYPKIPLFYQANYLSIVLSQPALIYSQTVLSDTNNAPICRYDMSVQNLRSINSSSSSIPVITFLGKADMYLVGQYNDMSTFISESYYSINNGVITLLSYNISRADFVLNSNLGCSVGFYYNATSAKFYKNHRLLVFYDQNTTQHELQYTLSELFFGTNSLSLVLLYGSQLSFNLQGDCRIYAPTYAMSLDYLNIPGNYSCSVGNCSICLDNSTCLVCMIPYYLDTLTNQCVSSCIPSCLLDFEMKCICNVQPIDYNMTLSVMTTSYCSNLIVTQSISPTPTVASYLWSIINVTGGNITLSLPSPLVTTSLLDIPNTYLLPGIDYKIVLVVTIQGQTVTNETIFMLPVPFNAELQQGPIYFYYNQDFMLYFNFICYCDYQNVSMNFLPSIPSGLSFMVYPIYTEFSISSCTFPSNSTTLGIIEYRFANYIQNVPVTLQATPANLISLILNGDKKIAYTSSINLTSFISYVFPCPLDMAQIITYSWSCIYISGASPCSLPPSSVTNTQDLNVIGSTFGPNDKIKFILVVSAGTINQTIESTILFDAVHPLRIKFQCSQNISNICFISNLQENLRIVALVEDQILLNLEYYWSMSTNQGISSFDFLNEMKIIFEQSPSVDYIRVNLTVSNSTHNGFAMQYLKVALAPIDGDFIVFPESGVALQTNFYLNSPAWYDLDLPLSYSFSYLVDSQWRSLAIRQNLSSMTTVLPYWVDSFGNITLKAQVFDVFGSMAEVTRKVGLDLSPSTVQTDLNSLFLNYNNSGDLRFLQIASVTLKSVVGSLVGTSFGSNEQEIMNKLQSYDLLNNPQSKTDYYNVLNDISSNLTQLSSNLVSNVFNLVYSLKGQGYDNLEQAKTASNIINNLYQYISKTDCSLSTPLGQQLNNKSIEVLETIVSNLQNDMVTNENASIITTKSFDIYARRLTDCVLVNSLISTSDLAPILKLKYQNIGQQCQNRTLLFSYYALAENLFKCNYQGGDDKTDISLKVQILGSSNDSQSILKEFIAEIIMPKKLGCLNVCTESSGICLCGRLDLFDLKGQITNLFRNSNFKYLGNVSAIRDWKFYEDPVFWILIGIILCAICSDILLRKKFKDVCWIKSYQSQKRNSEVPKSPLKTLFWVSHPLIGVFISEIPELSKRKRSFVYYGRLVSMIAFAAVFKTKENKATDMLLNPYLLILPYFTFIPVYMILELLLENPKPKKSQMTTQPKRNYKAFVGMGILIAVTGAWIAIMMIIAANLDMETKLIWVIQFCQILTQDMVITPFLILMFQFGLFKLLRSKMVKRNKKIADLLRKALGYPFIRIIGTSKAQRLTLKLKKQKTEEII